MPNRAGIALHRMYADFLMPSRLPTYRRLLESMLAGGYAVVSIETYWKRLGLGPSRRRRPRGDPPA